MLRVISSGDSDANRLHAPAREWRPEKILLYISIDPQPANSLPRFSTADNLLGVDVKYYIMSGRDSVVQE